MIYLIINVLQSYINPTKLHKSYQVTLELIDTAVALK